MPSKLGISPLLASVLLIAATVVISTMLAGWLASTTSITQTTITNKTNEGVACAAAEIVIDDVYITTGASETASVILRNSGMTDDLTITSAQLYNKNGDNISATNVPISNFDKGNIATLSFNFKPAGDSSKYGNNGTLMNGSILAVGRYGSAISFDGIDDYVNVNNSLNYLFGSGDNFTLSAWVKSNSFGTWRNILRIDTGGTNRDLWLFRYATNNKLQMVFGDEGATLHTSNSNRSITDTNWHYVVGIVNATQDKVYVYIDGDLEANDTDSSSTWRTDDSDLRIGAVGYTAGTYAGIFAEFFNGTIDDVAIWNRSLTNAEINTSMNQGPLSVSNTNDLVGYWSFDGGIVTCPSDFSRIVVTTNCGGVSAEFSKPPKCR